MKRLKHQALTAAIGFFLLATAVSSCGKGKRSIPGLEDFYLGVLKAHLYVSFVAKELHWDQGLSFPIPGLADSEISIAPDLKSSGTVFQVSLSLAALLNHGSPLPWSGLPDGRDLPDILGGQLPRKDIDLRGLVVSLYFSEDTFGMFIPLRLVSPNGIPLPWPLSIPIEDERGNRLGKGYAIPANVSGSGSGLLVLLPYLGNGTRGNQSLN